MKRALFVLCTATFAGCAHAPPKLPAPDNVALGGTQTPYHDLSKVPVCDMEGKQLVDELGGVNKMLAYFLEQTAPDGKWTQEKVDLLDQGLSNLPKVVAIQEGNLRAASKCKDMKPALLVQDTLQRTGDLVSKTKQRLEEGPQLLTQERQKVALERWKAQQVQAVKAAHDEWCPPNLKPWVMPEIYYAVQDETGRTIWLFCDGAKVVSDNGQLTRVPPPDLGKKKLHHSEKEYVAKTHVFPADQIQRPPGATAQGPQSATTAEGQ